MKAELASDKL
jgi:NADPH:quinone reductase